MWSSSNRNDILIVALTWLKDNTESLDEATNDVDGDDLDAANDDGDEDDNDGLIESRSRCKIIWRSTRTNKLIHFAFFFIIIWLWNCFKQKTGLNIKITCLVKES